LLLAVGLTACAPAPTATAPAATAPAAAVPTKAAAPTTAAPTQAEQPAKATEPAAQPQATPDIDKIVNAQPDDHKLGAQTPNVTIIEWGDFQ
jgi:hypothetical protein